MIGKRKHSRSGFPVWLKVGLIFSFAIAGVVAIEWIYQLSGDTTAEFSSLMYEQLSAEDESASDLLVALLTDEAEIEQNFNASEFTEGDFAREVLPIDDRIHENFHSSDSGIVSFWLPQEDIAEVFDLHQELLYEKGWLGFKSEGVELGSYVKSEGIYRWILLSCTSTSGGTTVVIQYREER